MLLKQINSLWYIFRDVCLVLSAPGNVSIFHMIFSDAAAECHQNRKNFAENIIVFQENLRIQWEMIKLSIIYHLRIRTCDKQHTQKNTTAFKHRRYKIGCT